jgi:hypothetical protein
MSEFTEVSCAPAPIGATFALICDPARWPLFVGYGPLPGITLASVEGGGPIVLGARIRVENTDRSLHYERVVAFEQDRHLQMHMELEPPASWFMSEIDEFVDLYAEGAETRVVRRFVATPRAWYTAPMAWLFGGFFLARAVRVHNANVAKALAVSQGAS